MDVWECYARMLLIRRFEEAVERLFAEGRVMGTAHVCTGQEAVAVGVAAALAPGDALTSTHRGHGHFLAVGADPGRMMAEMFGKATGYARGRGGSQMMSDLPLGFYGANGITAGSMAFACGLALEARTHRTGRVVVCIIGDGASNQGLFHESLNLAALWRLPLVVVCENNRYAMSTPIALGLANTRLADRGAAYGIPASAVDGNVLEEVRAAVAGRVPHLPPVGTLQGRQARVPLAGRGGRGVAPRTDHPAGRDAAAAGWRRRGALRRLSRGGGTRDRRGCPFRRNEFRSRPRDRRRRRLRHRLTLLPSPLP